MDTSNIQEMRELSDAPTLMLMCILFTIFIISMLCEKIKID